MHVRVVWGWHVRVVWGWHVRLVWGWHVRVVWGWHVRVVWGWQAEIVLNCILRHRESWQAGERQSVGKEKSSLAFTLNHGFCIAL